jgi:hypothetical protein
MADLFVAIIDESVDTIEFILQKDSTLLNQNNPDYLLVIHLYFDLLIF